MDLIMDGFAMPNIHVWFRQNSFICTPDNGLLYQSRFDVNYIAPLDQSYLPRTKIFNVKGIVKSLACSMDWSERRQFATYDDQYTLQVWDLDKGVPVQGHKGHHHRQSSRPEPNNDVTSAVCFVHSQKIVSIDHCTLIIYCLITDTYKVFPEMFRGTAVTIAPCPNDRDIVAVGLRDGLIIMIDLRKPVVLHKLRGHDREVVAIDWMMVPVRSEPRHENWRREDRPKKEARKKKDKRTSKSPEKSDPAGGPPADASDIFDIYDYSGQEEEFGTIVDPVSSSYEQRDRFREKVHSTAGFDFLEACRNLKEEIMKAKERDDAEDDKHEGPEDKPTGRGSALNTDDENDLDEAEKLRDFIIVDGEGKEKQKCGSDEDLNEETENEETQMMVLVTSGRENVICFWNYESGVIIDRVILPNSNVSKRLCTAGAFITAVWVNPYTVVANSVTGNIFAWKVSFCLRGQTVKLKAQLCKTRYPVDAAIFVVRARGLIGDDASRSDYVWCQSLNRKIMAVTVTDSPEVVAELNCLAIGSMCVTENPMESTVLAVGCNDKRLVTVNLASMSYNYVNCMPYMNKICSKVTALDWHPERENIIAFGTSEGRIGVLDTNNQINVPVLLNSFISTDVYALKWCEMTDELRVRQTVLFATGKNKMAYYKMKPGKHELIEVHDCGLVSSVSASGNYLLVGTQDGFVYIKDLNKNLAQIYRRSITHRYITSMQFKENILAVASNENSIKLIDFTKSIDDKVDDNIKLLEGHSLGVCCLRWGHGDSKLLVSASFDSTVRVWDTSTFSCLSIYSSIDSVFCAIFSPIHDNVVIFTGKGITLSFIDYTKYPPSEKPLTKKTKPITQWGVNAAGTSSRKKNNRERKEKITDELSLLQLSDKTEKAEEQEEKLLSKTEPTGSFEEPAPVLEVTVKPDPQIDELANQLKQIKFKEIKPIQVKSNVPTTFHLANREINKPADVLACIVKVANFKKPEDDEGELEEDIKKEPDETDEAEYFNEKLFTTEKALRELIAAETKNHNESRTSSIGTILLPQIAFRLKEVIIERIASRTLTDQLVALAPSISYEFWRKCCEAYGYQFLEKQYTLASIPYFLACHRITESIDFLSKHRFFREAWAICKLRKAEDDPICEQVCTEWAQYLEASGNFEGAALVWTAAKKYENAIAALTRRKEITEDTQRTIDVLSAKLTESVE
ncbi:protein rigor mortis [Sabethes cyaneus]|uniref:protein rigor mortis n=1 Tax=Sabethes cyaneus TaxID=53552 RepID=UPI00237D856A|nr:protein rigor mortis [Sabethes cyaneus]